MGGDSFAAGTALVDRASRIVCGRVDAELSPSSRRTIQRSRTFDEKLLASVAAGGTAYAGGLRSDCGARFRHQLVSPDFALLVEPAGAAGVGADSTIRLAGVHLSANALVDCRGIGFGGGTAATSSLGDFGYGGDLFADSFAEPDADVVDIARFTVVVMGL